MLIARCGGCGQKYALPEQAAGTQKECRKCGEPIDVPRRKYDLPVATRPKPQQLPTLHYPTTPHRRNPFFYLGPYVLGMTAVVTILAVVFLVSRPLWYTPPIAPDPVLKMHTPKKIPRPVDDPGVFPPIAADPAIVD